MFSVILMFAMFSWIGYKSGQSYFNEVSPLLLAVCMVLAVTGICFWISPSVFTALVALFANAWNLGVVYGFLSKRRVAGQ